MIFVKVEKFLIFLILIILTTLVNPMSDLTKAQDDENIIYVAPVIHMNQLILDPRKAYIYGGAHPADVFREEIEIILRNSGAKLVIDITGLTLYDLTWATSDIIEKI